MRTIIGLAYYEVKGLVGQDSSHYGDMLRHDVAFANDSYPHLICYPQFKARGHSKWGGIPTTDRWRSFGISITRVYLHPHVQLNTEHLLMEAEHWYTIRNEQKVTLTDYLKLK